MNKKLKSIVENENIFWSQVFQSEINKNSPKDFSSFWWQDYYEEMSKYVSQIIAENGFSTILEAGSGSGKATILLKGNLHKTFLDISSVALEYAKHLANKFENINVNFIEGNIFSMPFAKNNFDFVWNIGVAEHFSSEDIRLIIQEMMRVCKKDGVVAVGIPNWRSGAIIKARLLKYLKFFPGYRINTEKFYEAREIKNIIREVADESGYKIDYIRIEYFGNPLIIETPKFLLKTLGRPIASVFKKNKFLILVICKFK